MNPITQRLIERGVSSMNLTSLPQPLKESVLKEVASSQERQGNHDEAALALSMIESPVLAKLSRDYLERGNTAAAAVYAFKTKNAELQKTVANACLAAGRLNDAARLFHAAGDDQLSTLLKENK
jgi:hypothetical protein